MVPHYSKRQLIIQLLSLCAAALVVYSLAAWVIGLPLVENDSSAYNTAAMRLLNTGVYKYDVWGPYDVLSTMEPTAFTVPGYTIFLSMIYAFLPHDGASVAEVIEHMIIAQPWIIGVQMIVSVITVALITLAANLIRGLRLGWIAGLLTVCYLPIGFNATVSITEPLSLMLMALMILLLVMLLRSPDSRPRSRELWLAAALGLTAGSFIMVRPVIAAWLVVPVAAWLYSRRHDTRRALMTLALAGLCLTVVWAPWVARNYQVYGTFVPFTSSSGKPLLDSIGGSVFTPEEEVLRSQAIERGEDPDGVVAKRRLADRWNRDPVEYLSWKVDTLLWGVSEPAILPKGMIENFRNVGGYPEGVYADAGHFKLFTDSPKRDMLFGLTARYHLMLIVLALVGSALSRKRIVMLVLTTLPVYYAIIHTLLLFQVRYFYPAMAAVIILASFALVELFDRVVTTRGHASTDGARREAGAIS